MEDCSVLFAIQMPNTPTLPSKISQCRGKDNINYNKCEKYCNKGVNSSHRIPVREVIIPGLADAEKIWREKAFGPVLEDGMTKVWQMENVGESPEGRRG